MKRNLIMSREVRFWLSTIGFCAAQLAAQTTQGILMGRVMDRESGLGVTAATVSYTNLDTNERACCRLTAPAETADVAGIDVSASVSAWW
jgi:hypothetical protein